MSRRWIVISSVASTAFAVLALVPAPVEIGVSPFDRYGVAAAHGDIPYRDFSMEYPPGALPPIVLPALAPDLSYQAAFRGLETFLGIVLLVCLAYLLRDLHWGELAFRVGLTAATPLLLGPVIFFRFDLWPAMLIVGSLVALEHSRVRLSAALVGAAIAAKLFAGVLLPVVLVRTGRRGLVWSVGIAAVLTLPFALLAPGGVAESFFRQLGRGVQIESVPGSLIGLASLVGLGNPSTQFGSGSWNVTGAGVTAIGLLSTSLGLGLLAVIWALLLRVRDEGWCPPVAYAGMISIVLASAKVLSPQFLLWLVPLVVLVRGAAGVVVSALLAVAMVLTQLVYPFRYEELVALQQGPLLILAARNLTLVAAATTLTWLLVRELQRKRVTEHER